MAFKIKSVIYWVEHTYTHGSLDIATHTHTPTHSYSFKINSNGHERVSFSCFHFFSQRAHFITSSKDRSFQVKFTSFTKINTSSANNDENKKQKTRAERGRRRRVGGAKRPIRSGGKGTTNQRRECACAHVSVGFFHVSLSLSFFLPPPSLSLFDKSTTPSN